MSGVAFMSSAILASHIHNGASETWSAGWTVLAIWMVWADAVRPCEAACLLQEERSAWRAWLTGTEAWSPSFLRPSL